MPLHLRFNLSGQTQPVQLIHELPTHVTAAKVEMFC
jgi:hypothetical protein